MSKSTDRILQAIDAGLQNSAEPSYGEGDSLWKPETPVCVRCRGELDDGDLCEACRLFLSGDSDSDPLTVDGARLTVDEWLVLDGAVIRSWVGWLRPPPCPEVEPVQVEAVYRCTVVSTDPWTGVLTFGGDGRRYPDRARSHRHEGETGDRRLSPEQPH